MASRIRSSSNRLYGLSRRPSNTENLVRDAPAAEGCRNPYRREFILATAGLTAAAGLAGLSGCASAKEPGLRIASIPWIGYELLYLSQQLAPQQTQGVHLVELLSNTDTMQALAAGNVDGAGLTLDEVIAAHSAGLDLKIILVMDFSAGGDVLLARPEIDQLALLKGKRIGVEQTAIGAAMLDAALKQAGLTIDQVDIVNLTLDQQLAAFKNKQVDALVSFEPTATQLEAAGARRLFDSRAIPGSIVDVLAISEKALQANPATTRRLLAQYFAALAYFRQHPDLAAERISPRLGLAPQAVTKGYQGLDIPNLAENHRLLSGESMQLKSTVANLAAMMLRNKQLARPIDVSRLMTNSYLPEASA